MAQALLTCSSFAPRQDIKKLQFVENYMRCFSHFLSSFVTLNCKFFALTSAAPFLVLG